MDEIFDWLDEKDYRPYLAGIVSAILGIAFANEFVVPYAASWVAGGAVLVVVCLLSTALVLYKENRHG